MNQLFPKTLTCPVIREATPQDAEEIANLQINTDSEKISGVFRDNLEGAFEVLTKQFSSFYEGVYVLTEAEEIIGAMKIHLPGKNPGKTISLRSLVSILGWKKGLRAAFLLGNWDEYKLHAGESYLEFLYIHPKWQGYGGGKLLVRKALEIAKQSGSTYMTLFTATENNRARNLFQSVGFTTKRKIKSPVAKILGATSSWVKQSYTIQDGPVTFREMVNESFTKSQRNWKSKRSQVMAAARLTLILTLVPLIGGSLAYIRGYPMAVLFWVIIGSLHLISVRLILIGSNYGKYTILAAMLPEGINTLNRAIHAESWISRSSLFSLSLLNVWVGFVVLAYYYTNPVKVGKPHKTYV